MDKADLSGKQVAIFGKKGMGKSGLVNHFMSKMEGHYACFDPMHEHTDLPEEPPEGLKTPQGGRNQDGLPGFQMNPRGIEGLL